MTLLFPTSPFDGRVYPAHQLLQRVLGSEAALQAEADRLGEISQHIYGTIAANKAALDAYMAAVTTCNANGGIGDSSGRRHLQLLLLQRGHVKTRSDL